jgi:hypothetical protein
VDAINKIEILRKNRDYGAMEDPRISQWTDFVAEIDKALEQAELASWTEKMEKASPAEALKLREFACNQLLGEARTLVLNERVNIAENILRTRGIKWEPDPGE